MRQKLQDLPPFERVRSRLKAMNVDELTEVGTRIMAYVIAQRVYVQDNPESISELFEKICKDADKLIRENSLSFAMARVSAGRAKNDGLVEPFK